MSGLIERMARAMAMADGKGPDAPAWVRHPGAEAFGVCWRDQYEGKARAALAAIRDPGPHLIALGESYSDMVQPKACGPNTAESRREELLSSWRIIIDTALGDPSHD